MQPDPKALAAIAKVAIADIQASKSSEAAQKVFVKFQLESGLAKAFSALVHGPRITGSALAKAQKKFLSERRLLPQHAVPLFEKLLQAKDLDEVAIIAAKIQTLPAETDFLRGFQLALPATQDVVLSAVNATGVGIADLVNPWAPIDQEPIESGLGSHTGATNTGAFGAGFGGVVGGAMGASGGPVGAAFGAAAGAIIFGAIGAIFGDFFDRGRDDATGGEGGGEGGDGGGEI